MTMPFSAAKGINGAILSTLPFGQKMENLVSQAATIVNEANNRGILLRIMGAIAFRIHCPTHLSLFGSLKRELSDLDFATYKIHKPKIEEMFQDLGFELRRAYLYQYMQNRQIYDPKKNGVVADVFYDELSMCHTVDFRNRLELDSPTIPLTELLLEKMQIVKLTEKDVVDTLVLLAEHEIGEYDKETINVSYIADLLARDWGFYYTVTTNLKRVSSLGRNYVSERGLADSDLARIVSRIDRILTHVEETPKSTKWKMRAKVGPAKKWYREV